MSNAPERLVTAKRAEEAAAELALRPQTLDDFIGQKQVRENLKIFIAAAKGRGEALDHVLLDGPAGAWQDDDGADRGARAWRGFPLDVGPRHCTRR